MISVPLRDVNGKEVTVALKKELFEQVPTLANQNMSHSEFAERSLQDLFSKDLLDKAMVKEGKWFKSSIAYNEGDGQFTIKALPQQVQFSSVNAIMSVDLNGDDLQDLILGGNDSGFMPQYSKLEASFGHILLNEGEGSYIKVRNVETDFTVMGDIRNFIGLKLGDKDCLLTLINNQTPRMFEITKRESENQN